MDFPSPTAKQARIFWVSITALAVGVLLGLISLLLWGVGWVLNQLSSVLLPLALAGIMAYLLDPVVDFFEHQGIPRRRAILWVFFLGVMSVLMLLAMVLPLLVVEVGELIHSLPDYAQQFRRGLSHWLESSRLGINARQVWDSQFGATAQAWLTKTLPVISTWVLARMAQVASWAGLVIGLALVPIYLYYFLLEKQGIADNWTDYLPLRESRVKEEVVFVLTAINDHLIVFFRGQILVALCDGVLLTLGFLALGLKYALILGLVAGLLSIVPYLGVMISIIPATGLALAQFGDWLHPLLVLAVFVLVQMLEGFVISPKIIGDRVGLHPLTIILAVMVGTTLLGGILGGVLAIPLTAALRVLMFRYVWRKPELSTGEPEPRDVPAPSPTTRETPPADCD
ncbi:MAG: AI-2E family transporter [Candidatus Omnitrophica bacterium]|nr:AI-2E family transporter [Candidatus Omnitrophota bacterium]